MQILSQWLDLHSKILDVLSLSVQFSSFSSSCEELAKCSQKMSCGQCEVSKHLASRHILKSIVKKLEEKNQKFSFSKLDLSLLVHMQSVVLLPLWPVKRDGILGGYSA